MDLFEKFQWNPSITNYLESDYTFKVMFKYVKTLSFS